MTEPTSHRVARRPRPARASGPAPTRRCRGDDGALIVELALVAPLMVVLLLGIFEFGTVWRNENLLSSALRGAARVESQQSTSTSADQLAIRTFGAAIAQMKNTTLVRLVIYDSAASGAVYGPCTTTDVTTTPLGPHGRPTSSPNPPTVGINCNVYSPQQVAAVLNNTAPAGSFGCGASAWDQYYCPANRNNTLGNLDKIGVWAQFTYTDVSNLFPTSTMTMTDWTVYTIQPSV
jgi:Flp pilus assembly protein TadG